MHHVSMKILSCCVENACHTYLLHECVKISIHIYLDIKKSIQPILCSKKKIEL